MIKIAIHQFNPTVGAISANVDQLIQSINQAAKNGCHLFVSSELAICGYPPEDLLFRSDFYTECQQQLQRFKSIANITMLIGCPYTENGLSYNSVFAISDGEITARYDKQLLPNYGVFDEKRYFSAGNKTLVIECNRIKIGVIICEDVWQEMPAKKCMDAGADLICVLNASPYEVSKHKQRLNTLRLRVGETKLPFIYVNQWGGQDELVFDGASFAINPDQGIIQFSAFSDAISEVEYLNNKLVCSDMILAYPEKISAIYTALVVGVRDYINKNGFKGALLGLSGGIDSALTLAIAVDALGANRVMAVMMPSQYTAAISVIDSREMIKRLGVRYEEIEINPIFKQFEAGLEPIFNGLTNDTTEENLQARTRGTLLMAISNKLGYLVLTTGNKSEMTTGYATLYGDMAGGFAVLKDVLKTTVYELSRWRNTVSDIIPKRIITRPPSAELRDNQMDQDSLPDYAVLDQIIDLMVEDKLSSSDILAKGFALEDVTKVARLLKMNEYKRRQAAVGPKISQSAYAKDWRYPITNGFKF